MKKCSKCGLEKSKADFYRDKSRKDGLTCQCKECMDKQSKEYISKNYESVRKRNNILDKKRRSINAASDREKSNRWRYKHPEKSKESNIRWKKNNRASCLARNALRRSRKLNATPRWADLMAINRIYFEAKKKTSTTGVVHHVDHAIPLQGKTVCGLHCEDNLQVITAEMNLKKQRVYCQEINFG